MLDFVSMVIVDNRMMAPFSVVVSSVAAVAEGSTVSGVMVVKDPLYSSTAVDMATVEGLVVGESSADTDWN